VKKEGFLKSPKRPKWPKKAKKSGFYKKGPKMPKIYFKMVKKGCF